MEGTFADPRFGVFRYLSPILYRYYLVRDRRECLPCDGLDMRDFAGIQERIRGATVGGADIESDDELSRKAVVTGAGCFHDGGQRSAMGGFGYLLGTPHISFT